MAIKKPSKATSEDSTYKDGTLRVRVIRAHGLRAADKHVFAQSTSDPYVEVSLTGGGDQEQRRTKTHNETLAPAWREEFPFRVRREPDVDSLTLTLDVWDEDDGEEHDFLGVARLELDAGKLSKVNNVWRKVELELESDESRCEEVCTGVIQLGLRWEPLAGHPTRQVVVNHLKSAYANNVAGLALIGLSGLLLIVATEAQWFRRDGSDETLDVPVAETCSFLGGLCAFACFGCQFLGLGSISTWRPGVPQLVEPPGKGMLKDNDSGLAINFQQEGMLRWFIALDLSGLSVGPILVYALRLISWLCLLASAALSGIAIGLCWLERPPDFHFGGAWWLCAVAGVNTLSSAGLFIRAGKLFKRDLRFQSEAGSQAKKTSPMNAMLKGPALTPDSSGRKDARTASWFANAGGLTSKVQHWKEEVEHLNFRHLTLGNLTQPLLGRKSQAVTDEDGYEIDPESPDREGPLTGGSQISTGGHQVEAAGGIFSCITCCTAPKQPKVEAEIILEPEPSAAEMADSTVAILNPPPGREQRTASKERRRTTSQEGALFVQEEQTTRQTSVMQDNAFFNTTSPQGGRTKQQRRQDAANAARRSQISPEGVAHPNQSSTRSGAPNGRMNMRPELI